jgi:hypothetical protein
MTTPYASVQDIRDRGVPDTQATDPEVGTALGRATLLVEAFSGRDFWKQTKTVWLDGNGKETVFLQDRPILQVFRVWVDDIPLDDGYEVYGEEGYIRLYESTHFPWTAVAGVFPEGARNVRVRGNFGFDAVPDDVKEACIILALRELKGLRDEAAPVESGIAAGTVRQVKVDDISVSLDPSGGAEGREGLLASTGDTKADRLLAKYRTKVEPTAV